MQAEVSEGRGKGAAQVFTLRPGTAHDPRRGHGRRREMRGVCGGVRFRGVGGHWGPKPEGRKQPGVGVGFGGRGMLGDTLLRDPAKAN